MLRTHRVGEPGGGKGLAELERLVSAAGRALGIHGRPLFVPRDEALAWIWLPLANDAHISRELLEAAFDDGLGAARRAARVAVGEPAAGLAGFRQTHEQALRTRNLALIASTGTRVTTFAEVGALALICFDLDTARHWVLATLNDLAIDDEPHARLRQTLLAYITTGSYTLTAERMMLHKSTVQYRVAKAEQALGATIGDRRVDVGLALRACTTSAESAYVIRCRRRPGRSSHVLRIAPRPVDAAADRNPTTTRNPRHQRRGGTSPGRLSHDPRVWSLMAERRRPGHPHRQVLGTS